MRLRVSIISGCVLLLCGCTEMNPDWMAGGKKPTKPKIEMPRRVELVNLTSRADAISPTSLTLNDFLTTAAALQASGKAGRLQRFVERYPDVAIEMLRNTGPSMAGRPERIAVAAAYDRLFVSDASAGGWQAVFATMVNAPGDYRAEFDVRTRMRSFIDQGRFELTAQSSISQNGIAPFLRADELRLRGIAFLLNDEPDRAVADWTKGLSLAESDACVAAELAALLAEAHRRNERPADTAAAWQMAAAHAAGVKDVVFWERLVNRKPPAAAWPEAVRVQLIADADGAPWGQLNVDSDIDALVWQRIAEWRLARGDGSAALLAFAHAESQTESESLKGEARIGQARALLAMNQDGTAMSILSGLLESQNTSISHHAMALVGVWYLENGRTTEGFDALRRAVEEGGDARWPGYASAQSDLALALLMMGQETEGLRLMHDCQQAFQQQNKIAGLCQSLANEASYYEQAGDAARAQLARQQLAALERAPNAPDLR